MSCPTISKAVEYDLVAKNTRSRSLQVPGKLESFTEKRTRYDLEPKAAMQGARAKRAVSVEW